MKDFKVYQTSGMLNFLVSEASDVRKKEQMLSGDIVSFSADEQSPLKIVVDIDSTGWTGCEVNRTGVNVWDEEWELGDINSATGQKTADNNRFRSKNYIPVLPSTTYYCQTGNYDVIKRMAFYDADKTYLGTSTGWLAMPDGTITTPANAYYALFFVADSTYNNDISINYPSTDTDYHAYSGTTLSVTFPNEVGTITDGTLTIDYDGSVTLKTGGQTYTLTSVSPIETYVGDNNIWADAGPVSVTYPI